MASTLFFGVFVNSLALCFAAEAYHTQHRTLLAIDLIRRRRRTDRLKSASPSSLSSNPLARFPDEVWSLVKLQLIDQALEDAEYSQDDRYDCGCPVSNRLWRTPKRWTREHFEDCYTFSDVLRGEPGLAGLLNLHSEKIEFLLDAFGLDRPFESYWCPGAHPELPDELDALEALGVSLRPANDPPRPSLVHVLSDSLWNHRSPYSVVAVSHSTVPPRVGYALRLNRLVALFNLAVENPSSRTLVPSVARLPPISYEQTDSDSSSTAESKGIEAEVKAEEKDDAQHHNLACCSSALTAPHWFLVEEY
ncbi:hypothetical protein JCM11491_000966 [Sporobolomyces phaffii]